MSTNMMQLSCEDFVSQLASNNAVPGGGGAAAFVGAIGVALGNMVAALTVGKKKYAAVEDDIIAAAQQAETLRVQLLSLIQADAQGFAPLAAAYALPVDTVEQREEKTRVLEAALVDACRAPLAMMQACCSALELLEILAEKGSRLAVSDAGCGAACCKAALQSACLNVFINTKLMRDRQCAARLNRETQDMLDCFLPLADRIYARVLQDMFQ